MRRLFVVWTALLWAFAGMAQKAVLTERYNVSYLDLKNGLPHNNISAVFVDSNGFLWVATYGGGLVRYDGYGMMQPKMRLNSNSCKSIAEDRFKRLWVAFDEGSDIIDLKTMAGMSQERLRVELCSEMKLSETVNKLLQESSTKTYCDALGRIWLITYTHVNQLSFDAEGRLKNICAYRYRGNTPDVNIRDVEGNGKPWIGIDGGLYRLAEKNGELVREEISPLLRQLDGLYVTDLIKRGDVVWITTNHGLFRYDPYRQRLDRYTHNPNLTDAPNGKLIPEQSSPTRGLSHEFLSSLALTSDNTLLVGSLCGVNVYDDASDSFTAWSTASHPPLKSDFVHSLTMDRGLIWVGTESGGVAQLVPRQLLLQNYVHSTTLPTSISPNPVNAMYVEPNGTLWVGTVEGGLNRKEKGQQGFSHYTKENSALSHNSVSTLAADGNGRLWIGTWGGGLNVMNHGDKPMPVNMTAEQARLTNFIGALAYDPYNDGLWIGSNDGVFLYDVKTNQLTEPFDSCQLIRGCVGALVDGEGVLWMGCMQGVIAIDLKSYKSAHQRESSRRNGQFSYRHLKYRLDRPDSRIYEKISSFCESRDGSLWLGSNGYGLYHRVVDKDGEEHFDVLTQEDGLVNNAVKGIVEDQNGRLWITTQNGLSVYDSRLKTFTNYSQADGLASSQFYWNSAAIARSGIIYLGSEAGLIEVTSENPEAVSQANLVFTHLMVDNQDILAGSDYLDDDISIAKTIRLSEGNRSFSIDFSALNYGHETQGVFSYRMKGFENEWTLLKPGQHSVRYSALPVGNYTFEVKYKSAVDHGGENDAISVDIIVKPYFWNSWWFRLLLSVLFIGLVIYIYNRRVAELKRREAEQLLSPIREVLEESEDPRQLQTRIRNILDNQERYKQSVTKSVEADKEEVMKSTRPFMERVMEIMEQNYTNSEFGVQEFCDALGMSRSVASKHLNAEVGAPAGQFIRNYRLNMAKEMLSAKTGNRNITEVAYRVGFNDPKYFTRCFTKMFGMSPSAYGDN
jgi:ligand-binding sensor domain-containing protein/AraC-like DNA-binding protein